MSAYAIRKDDKDNNFVPRCTHELCDARLLQQLLHRLEDALNVSLFSSLTKREEGREGKEEGDGKI